MKRIVILFLCFVVPKILLGFSISEIDFDKTIKVGKTAKKTVVIKNDEVEVMRYDLSIEGDKNVLVQPRVLIIKPYEKKSFDIQVVGEKVGDYEYSLIITEKGIKKEKGLPINMTYDIEQKYRVVK